MYKIGLFFKYSIINCQRRKKYEKLRNVEWMQWKTQNMRALV